MTDKPTTGEPLVAGIGSLQFPSREALENAITRDNGLGDAGAIPSKDGYGRVIDLKSGKEALNKSKNYMEGLADIAGQILSGKKKTDEDYAAEGVERGKAGSNVVSDFAGNIAFMALGGAMIVAGIWMLGGAGSVAQTVVRSVGVKR